MEIDRPDPRPAPGPDVPLHEVVQRHAASRPDALAIEHGPVRLTYRQLDVRANHLARDLVAAGAGRGRVVAVHVGRSAEWVVGMLATLKTGAVCMPLDPSAPAERAERAMTAARPAATVVSGRGADPQPPALAPVLPVDATAPEPADPGAPDVDMRADDLAYAMHTSGSSGRAKIVMAQHRWLSYGAHDGASISRTTPADRGSWLGAAGAGIAVHEVCSLLWTGASTHVGEKDTIASPPALRDWLVTNRITQAFVVTPVGEVLQGLEWPPDVPLRLMTLGGDRLNSWWPPDLPFEVAVSYGSLEAFQIANTLHPWGRRCSSATAGERDLAAPPPVGRPLPGVAVHVLEEDMSPTAPGEIGEVWIHSPALSLGYLGDPALTADRFRPNPFGVPGSRLYRSGDAGRFRDDSVLEHHGRIDDVVKIRGHRVELGDVEWALGAHPQVRQVCVVPAQDTDGQRKLVACFTSGGQVSPGDLRDHAARRLPDFMIPVAYVQLDGLPLNTSNKIDRRALPPADWQQWRASRPFQAPRGEVETLLARIFAELLAVPAVGANDHFLELGGDSLLAARLQDRIRESVGASLQLFDVMTVGTPAELAELVCRQRAAAAPPAASDLPPIIPRNRA